MSDAISEIRKGLDLLFQPGDIVEMRVPRKRDDQYSANVSGYFYDMDRLAQGIAYVNEKYKSTVYVMLNPLAKTWMGVNNRCYVGSRQLEQELKATGKPLEPRMKETFLWETGKVKYTMRMAEDSDIVKRRWILIDIDAGQPANTNSTDAEYAATLAMAKAVREFLDSRGFPPSSLTHSGNGSHVYLGVDLENTPENTFLVRRFLKALKQRFEGNYGSAHIDEAMFNAGRITKAAGTMVYKGKDTPERPCRQSHVIESNGWQPSTTDLVNSVADEYVLKPGETMQSWAEGIAYDDNNLKEKFRALQLFLDFYEIEYTNPTQQINDGDIVLPLTCPNAAEHSMDGGEFECVAMVGRDGSLSFCCQHAHCVELRTWRGMKNWLEAKTGKKYLWTDDNDKGNNVLVMDGDLGGPKRTVNTFSVPASQSEKSRVIKMLKELVNPSCTVVEAYAEAERRGIAQRAIREAYADADVQPEKGSDHVWRLVSNW